MSNGHLHKSCWCPFKCQGLRHCPCRTYAGPMSPGKVPLPCVGILCRVFFALLLEPKYMSGRHIWLAQKYFRMILLYFEEESYHFFFSIQPVSNWSGLAVQGRFQSCSTSLSKARFFSTCLALLKVSCKCHVLSENLNS